MAKLNTKSISNQGTFCNFSLAPKRKIHKTSLKHLKIHKFPFKNVIKSKTKYQRTSTILIRNLHNAYKYKNLPLKPHRSGDSWSAFPGRAVGELPCSCQPTAPTCVVWSWRLKECFGLASEVKGLWDRGLPIHRPDVYAILMSPNKGNNSCPWLPLPGCVHAWGTGQGVVWCVCAICFKFL